MKRYLLCLFLVVGLPPWACGATAAETQSLNILFIGVDDLRPEMGCYGQDRMVTPNIDRLAQRGVRFDRAFCNNAVCGASRASLMSGLRPTPTRFLTFYTRLDEDAPGVPSLAMTFKRHGYHTVTNGKIYHHRGDDADAWSEPDWRPRGGNIWWALKKNREMNRNNQRGPAYEAADRVGDNYPDHLTADKTIEDLRRLAREDTPFFIACGFVKPHLPFVAPKRFEDLYPVDRVQLPGNMYPPRDLPQAFDYNWGELRSYQGIPKRGPVSDATARELIRHYHACVSFTDEQIGRVLDELDRLGIADQTIIVLWGDHGWQLGEHGFWCKHTNFEVATRVPLIIVAPGVDGGQVAKRLVEYVDIYPTLCDLAGLPKPDHLQGKSMAGLLKDVHAEHKDAIFTRHQGGDAIRTDRYRYMEMRGDLGKGELLGVGLFDLQRDPHENQNVAEDPAYAQTLTELRTRLDAFRAEHYQNASGD